MSWNPNDLVDDTDLTAYERTILSQFNVDSWGDKRSKALEDWLWPILRAQGFDPQTFRTRYEADTVYGSTSSAFTDYSAASKDTTDADIPLASILLAGSDALYVGSTAQFRGIYFRLQDAVSSVAATLSVEYWGERWASLTVTNHTLAAAGTPLSAGGSVLWTLPGDWAPRTVSTSDRRYWVRVKVSSPPTGASASQVACIRRSVLCAPATLRTLALIFREAPAAQDGPWKDKALFYETEADAALQRALGLVAGEFDTDGSEEISADEAAQTSADLGGEPGMTLERR